MCSFSFQDSKWPGGAAPYYPQEALLPHAVVELAPFERGSEVHAATRF